MAGTESEKIFTNDVDLRLSEDAQVSNIEKELGISDDTVSGHSEAVPDENPSLGLTDLPDPSEDIFKSIVGEEKPKEGAEPMTVEGLKEESQKSKLGLIDEFNQNGFSGVFQRVKESREGLASSDPKTALENAVIGAVGDFAQNTTNSALDIIDGVDDFLQRQGLKESDLLTKDNRVDFSDMYLPSPQSGAESFMRTGLSYVVPFSAGMKAFAAGAKGAQLAAKAGGIGAATAFVALDPKDERLSDLIQSSPALSNPVTAYLASDPNDSGLEGRLKNSLESLIVDSGVGASVGLARPIFSAMKMHKATRALKKTKTSVDITPEQIEKSVLLKPKPAAESSLLKGKAQVREVASDLSEVSHSKFKIGRLSDDPGTNKVIQEFTADNKEFVSAVSRTGQNFDETIKKAKVLADDPNFVSKKVLGRKPGTILNAEERLAAEIRLSVAADELSGMVTKLENSANPADLAVFKESYDNFSNMFNSVKGSSAEAARALNAHKIKVSGLAKDLRIKQLAEVTHLNGGVEELSQSAAMIREIFENSDESVLAAAGKLVRKGNFKKLWDAAYEVRINGLVSGVKTQAVSIGSAMVRGPVEIAERGLAALYQVGQKSPVDKITFKEVGAQARAYQNETWNQIGSFQAGLSDSFKVASDAIRKGEAVDRLIAIGRERIDPNKITFNTTVNPEDFAHAISSEAFGYTGNLGKGIDLMGTMIRTPSRALLRGDQAVGAIHYRMEARSLATREATGRGLSGNEADVLIKALADDPIDTLPTGNLRSIAKDIRAQAVEKANANKFTSALEGMAASVDDIIKNAGSDQLAGAAPLKLMIPFSRVELNILAQTYERTPFAALGKSFKDDIAAGGSRAALAKARVTMGSMAMSTVSLLAWNGLVTGEGPKNPVARKLLENSGWQPNSIKIGGTYHDFTRVAEPYSKMLKSVANISEIVGAMDESQSRDLPSLTAMIAMAAVNSMTPEFMTGAMGDMIKAIEAPEKGQGVQRVVNSLVVGQVPFSGLLRDIRKTGLPGVIEGDPVRRDQRIPQQDAWDFIDQTINALKDITPGYSKDLPPQRDMLGRVRHYPPGLGPDIASPIAVSHAKPSVVDKELLRLSMAGPLFRATPPPGEQHLSLSMPSKTISVSGGGVIQNINLSPKQYDKLVQLSAGIGLDNNPFGSQTLEETLKKEISGGYPMLGSLDNDQNKRLVIKKIVNVYKQAALGQLQLDEPDIQDKMIQLLGQVGEVVTEPGEDPDFQPQ